MSSDESVFDKSRDGCGTISESNICEDHDCQELQYSGTSCELPLSLIA